MPFRRRYLAPAIEKDLSEKMVFLGGPRQVGKTTLAAGLLGPRFKTAYFNWDKISQRRQALKGLWPPEAELIILDEFHKHQKWKSWIKGEYDTDKRRHKFLLTGSARLDVYRRGGDSLQGRYHHFRLHPFSLAEMGGIPPSEGRPGEKLRFAQKNLDREYQALWRFGGFPEPLIRQDERVLRRWHKDKLERLIREDIRDLTMVQDIGNITLLAQILPERSSSVLSINALAEDLQVNFRTVANWLDIFERLYFCFRLAPHQNRTIASVRKEKKLYLWDWSTLTDPGDRLENLVASHLLKFSHYLADVDGWKTELFFIRDHAGREVDFLCTLEGKPWFAVEVKTRMKSASKQLHYFREKLSIPFCYQISEAGEEYEKEGIHHLPVQKFLTALV